MSIARPTFKQALAKATTAGHAFVEDTSARGWARHTCTRCGGAILCGPSGMITGSASNNPCPVKPGAPSRTRGLLSVVKPARAASPARVRRDVLAALALSKKLTEKLEDASTSVEGSAPRALAEALKALRAILAEAEREILCIPPGDGARGTVTRLRFIAGTARSAIARIDPK